MATGDFVDRGRELLAAGQFQEAVKVCRLGLLSTPTNVPGRLVLGQALLALRRYDEVLSEMRVALEVDHTSGLAYQLRGESLLCKGDAAAAAEALGQAKMFAPSDSRIAEMLARAERAMAPGAHPDDFGPGEVATRHYPGVPPDPAPIPVRTAPSSAASDRRTPPPEELAVGDSSGAVRLASEVSGLVLLDDDLAEPPPPAPPRDAIDDLFDSLDEEETHELFAAAEKQRIPANDVAAPPVADDVRARAAMRTVSLQGPAPRGGPQHEPPRHAAAPAPADSSGWVSRTGQVPPNPLAISSGPSNRASGSIPSPPAPALAPGHNWVHPTMIGGAPAPMSANAGGSGYGGGWDNRMVPYPGAPLPDRAATSMVASARPRRRPLLWVMIVLLVAGGGMASAYFVRDFQIKRRATAAGAAAEASARTDTWDGWKSARDRLQTSLEQNNSLPGRAALAAALAVLAAEFGDDAPAARLAVEALAGEGGETGVIARGWMAIADGNPAAADAAAADVQDTGASKLLAARAALLAGRWEDAAAAAEAATRSDPRPRAWLALAVAELARHRYKPAEDAVLRVLELSPEQPRALGLRADLLRATAIASSPAAESLAATLDRFATSASPAAPSEAAYAAVAVALLRYDLGDLAAAKASLALAVKQRPEDLAFAAKLIAALTATGDFAEARVEAGRAAKKWPQSPLLQIALADVERLVGQPSVALAEIAKAGDIAQNADALVVRGQAHLDLGDLEAARNDFDAALNLAPTLVAAIVARAQVDLRGQDAVAAVARLEPVVRGQTSPRPGLAAIYATALRATGRIDDAVSVLEKAIAGAGKSPDVSAAYLELGRLERDRGNFPASAAALEKAQERGGRAARLEAARLALAGGNPTSARAILEEIVKVAPSDPESVVELIPLRTLLGDEAGARALVESAEKIPGVVGWKLSREKGRLLMRASDFAAAAENLKAASAQESDAEPARLLVSVLLAQGAVDEADRIVAEMAVKFPRSPLRLTARGWVQVGRGKNAAALESFAKAEKEMRELSLPPRLLADAVFGRAVAQVASPAKAVAILREATSLDPLLVDAWFLLASFDPPLRIAHLERTVELNPVYADAWRQLAQAASAARQTAKAAAAAARYLKLAPEGEYAGEMKRLAP